MKQINLKSKYSPLRLPLKHGLLLNHVLDVPVDHAAFGINEFVLNRISAQMARHTTHLCDILLKDRLVFLHDFALELPSFLLLESALLSVVHFNLV